MNQHHILVVDDELDICELVKDILEDEGFKVSTAQDTREARRLFSTQRLDLVLLDIWMPGEDGISLLKDWQEESSFDIPVIIMSGHGTVETAIEATRLGAYEFIEKPLTTAKLLQSVSSALANQGTSDAATATIREPVGLSAITHKLRKKIARVAKGKDHVAIIGESGTGKTEIAKYIHSLSGQSGASLTIVSAAASK